jgi:hypothetical protein
VYIEHQHRDTSVGGFRRLYARYCSRYALALTEPELTWREMLSLCARWTAIDVARSTHSAFRDRFTELAALIAALVWSTRRAGDLRSARRARAALVYAGRPIRFTAQAPEQLEGSGLMVRPSSGNG